MSMSSSKKKKIDDLKSEIEGIKKENIDISGLARLLEEEVKMLKEENEKIKKENRRLKEKIEAVQSVSKES